MTEAAGAGAPLPRAFLRVGGVTLARHQLGLALTLDCQRVICLAREITPDLIALQHDAEKAGARFHIVAGPRALAGLITANDDLLALGDGLLADPQTVAALLEPGHAVLVQPVEAGVAVGFERIDINHAAAGAFRIPGRLIEGLLELPPDCDVISALTRIALQAGIAKQEVPAAAREGARWRLIRDEAEAYAAEDDWIRLHLGASRAATPSILLSRLTLLRLGPSLLHAGSGSRFAVAASLVVLLIALGAGWLGFAVAGFVFCAAAAVLSECAAALRRIEESALSLSPPSLSADAALGWVIDVVLVALVVWAVPLMPWETLLERAFAPVMLVILIRLAPRLFERGLAQWVDDRFLVGLLLALAAGIGFLVDGVKLLAVCLALAALLFAARPRD